MKRYLFYVILVVLILVIVFFLQDSEEYGWFRAKWGDKSMDYAQYMKAYPEGWHFFEAKNVLTSRDGKKLLRAAGSRIFSFI